MSTHISKFLIFADLVAVTEAFDLEGTNPRYGPSNLSKLVQYKARTHRGL